MIYLDNAATTCVKDEVMDYMLPYIKTKYGNPSGIYELGINNKTDINKAREFIAKSIGAKGKEIYFTSGGTESDNWALYSVAKEYKNKGKHIITSKIEHHAIINACKMLEKEGYEITYLDVDEYGIIKINQLKESIRKDTILVSVMFANNEIGTIQPIWEIGNITRKSSVVFHTDAVQAFCHLNINVNKMGIDMLSASAHKFHGPKGVGFLYCSDKVKLCPFMYGGMQESNMRPGTENVPGIMGMYKAVMTESAVLELNQRKIKMLRDYLITRILREIPFVRLNGHPVKRLASNASFSFLFVEGETLLVLLDTDGICASGGSACTTGTGQPSHVLKALGVSDEIAFGTLRLTISDATTKEEVDYVVERIKKHVNDLRLKSIEYKNINKQWR